MEKRSENEGEEVKGDAICRREMNKSLNKSSSQERMEAKTWNRYGENTGGGGGYSRLSTFSDEEEEYYFQFREIFWHRRAQEGNNNLSEQPPPIKWGESRSYNNNKLPRYAPPPQRSRQYENSNYRRERQFYQTGENSMALQYSQSAERFVPVFLPLRIRNNDLAEVRSILFQTNWKWHEKTFGRQEKKGGAGGGDTLDTDNDDDEEEDLGLMNFKKFEHLLPKRLCSTLIAFIFPATRNYNDLQEMIRKRRQSTGTDDFDSLSVTDSGVFSDNDACSSGRASPVSCKEAVHVVDRDRFSILTYDQVLRVDTVLNEMVALEGRGNFPALELKLKDLLTAVKDRLVQEGIKIRDIRLNGGAASYALKDRLDFCCVCGVVYQPSGNDDGGLVCSCPGSEQTKNFSYNDIDLIFGMELSTVKHFDRVKTAVLDALLDLLPPQVSRKRMSPCALKEAYVSKMVKVCEGDRWSLIALGNGNAGNSSSKGRSCSVELKFVDTMRRQYEFSVDSFQIVLDSLMLFYKCSNIDMSSTFYPTIVGESVYGDFYGALYHLQNGLIATRHPEEIRGGGLMKYCNLLVRGYRPADIHSITPLQRYMCSRFFIDFPEVEQQESKLRTYLANHMSGVSAKLRYAFLITLYHVVDSSTVCLMGHERRLTLTLIQRLACELFSTDGRQGIYGAQPSQMYCYPSTHYYNNMSHSQMASNSSSTSTTKGGVESVTSSNGTTYYSSPAISASTSSPAVLTSSSSSSAAPQTYAQRSTQQNQKASSSPTPTNAKSNNKTQQVPRGGAIPTKPSVIAASS